MRLDRMERWQYELSIAEAEKFLTDLLANVTNARADATQAPADQETVVIILADERGVWTGNGVNRKPRGAA